MKWIGLCGPSAGDSICTDSLTVLGSTQEEVINVLKGVVGNNQVKRFLIISDNRMVGNLTRHGGSHRVIPTVGCEAVDTGGLRGKAPPT